MKLYKSELMGKLHRIIAMERGFRIKMIIIFFHEEFQSALMKYYLLSKQ
jgi:hypothetical protein